MPFRFIFTIILIVFVAVETGFNLDNKCNIWLFHTFENVPVIVTILISFLLGVVVTLPSVFVIRNKKKNTEAESKNKTDKSPAAKSEATDVSSKSGESLS